MRRIGFPSCKDFFFLSSMKPTFWVLYIRSTFAYHSICFCWEVRKIALLSTWKNNLSWAMVLLDMSHLLQVLKLWGSAEAPQVLLETQGEMYFKPTCVGTSSKRTYMIKNVSRIPLRYINSFTSVCNTDFLEDFFRLCKWHNVGTSCTVGLELSCKSSRCGFDPLLGVKLFSKFYSVVLNVTSSMLLSSSWMTEIPLVEC